jgi:hypothetical protein
MERLKACFGGGTGFGRHPQAVADAPEDVLVSSRGVGGEPAYRSKMDALDSVHRSSTGGEQTVDFSDDEEVESLREIRLDDLPWEVLECILLQLKQSMKTHQGRKNSRKTRLSKEDVQTIFAVCGVSCAWRCTAHRVFFSSPWDFMGMGSHSFYQHPNQLFCTSLVEPGGSRSGLVKCYVERRHVQGHLVISMFLGKSKDSRSSFMLSAIGIGRSKYRMYLGKALNALDRGVEACAFLDCNLLCTAYALRLGSHIQDSLRRGVSVHPYRECNSSEDVFDVKDRVLSMRYRARMSGIMQPRRMEVALSQPESSQQDVDQVTMLSNKPPHWNEGLKCWCLNFRGRVRLASVKNFQLVQTGHGDDDLSNRVVMQFGKADEDVFILDFNPTGMFFCLVCGVPSCAL